MSADDTYFESAMNGLGLLTATIHDNHLFGPVARDCLAAVATDGRQVLRLATG